MVNVELKDTGFYRLIPGLVLNVFCYRILTLIFIKTESEENLVILLNLCYTIIIHHNEKFELAC